MLDYKTIKKIPHLKNAEFFINLAGEEGFEPSHAGIKTQCLNHLTTPQILYDNRCLSGCWLKPFAAQALYSGCVA